MLVPGEKAPAEGSETSSGSSTSSSSSSTASSTGGGNGLSKGAIAGIAIACAAFVIILGALFFVLGRNRVYQKWMSSQDGRTERTTRWALFNGPVGDPWSNRRSELDSNATNKPPTAEVASVSSPDPTTRTFSPTLDGSAYGAASTRHESGNWGWESTNPRNNRGPTELEAHSVVSHPQQHGDYF